MTFLKLNFFYKIPFEHGIYSLQYDIYRRVENMKYVDFVQKTKYFHNEGDAIGTVGLRNLKERLDDSCTKFRVPKPNYFHNYLLYERIFI